MTAHEADADRGGEGATAAPLRVEHIRVRSDRIEVQVRVTSEKFAYTDESLMERVLARYPSLAMHACRNHKGHLFADVMNRTSIPHLLEHLVVDGQTRRAKDPDRIFTGTTQWSAEDPLLATVSLSFEDDLVALEVLNRSVDFLNQLLLTRQA